jgi:DNA polymerase-3 subunit chi
MASINFYHLTSSPLERALPKLLEKSYAGGFRSVVVVTDDVQVEKLNTLLWTYDPNSFLPHGSIAEGNPEKQPILLTATLPEVAGQNEILFIANGALIDEAEVYERIIDMFDGGHEISLKAARDRWKFYKNKDLNLVYFKQNEKGGWEKVA